MSGTEIQYVQGNLGIIPDEGAGKIRPIVETPDLELVLADGRTTNVQLYPNRGLLLHFLSMESGEQRNGATRYFAEDYRMLVVTLWANLQYSIFASGVTYEEAKQIVDADIRAQQALKGEPRRTPPTQRQIIGRMHEIKLEMFNQSFEMISKDILGEEGYSVLDIALLFHPLDLVLGLSGVFNEAGLTPLIASDNVKRRLRLFYRDVLDLDTMQYILTMAGPDHPWLHDFEVRLPPKLQSDLDKLIAEDNKRLQGGYFFDPFTA